MKSFLDVIKNKVVGSIKNSSDPGAVLEAGHAAMQHLDPKLAYAVQQMPPEIAQAAIVSYTNAIRSGQDADASNVSANAVRGALQSYKPPAPTAQRSGLAGMAGRVVAGLPKNPNRISDIAGFDKIMHKDFALPGAETAPGPATGPAASNRLPGMFGRVPKLPAAPAAQATPVDYAANVRSAYSQYADAATPEAEKNLLWARPAQQQPKELVVPADWWQKKNAQQDLVPDSKPFDYTYSGGM